MDWFLYYRDLHHERVKDKELFLSFSLSHFQCVANLRQRNKYKTPANLQIVQDPTL